MSTSVKEVVERTDLGQFPRGVSGNPKGRPKGSKNAITLLKQSLEVQLREQAAPDMGAVLNKAVEMALDGHPGMIKLLLEMHVSKGATDDAKASEKVAIQINSAGGRTEVTTSSSKTSTAKDDFIEGEVEDSTS